MIRVRGLTKAYGGHRVVDAVSFDVAPGIVTGLVGPNGAGKSTTLKMLLGLVEPDRGRATVDGARYRDLGRAATVVGSALDGAEPLASSSPRRFLTLLALSQGLGRAAVDEVLEAMGLTTVAHRRCRGFSLGMRKRVALAAALLARPRYLVIDEPMNGMDPPSIVWLRHRLRSLAADGVGVLVASHLLDEQERTCDRLVVLAGGQVVASGTVGEVVARHGGRRLEVVVADGEAAALRGRLAELGFEFSLDPSPSAGLRRLTGDPLAAAALSAVIAGGGFHLSALAVTDGGLSAAFAALTDHRQQHALTGTGVRS